MWYVKETAVYGYKPGDMVYASSRAIGYDLAEVLSTKVKYNLDIYQSMLVRIKA